MCVTAAKNRAICNVNAREREIETARGLTAGSSSSHGVSHCEWAASHHVTGCQGAM